ncbi:MAG: hypothetical protein KJT03_22220, partial [Verrucomicrobiae bacterium]|nr:hypothetical protein [Verrucomicrobiae bacterium]
APGQSIDTGPLLFQDFELREVNARGDLLFSSTLFRNSTTVGSLWLLDNNGDLFFIAKEGDTLGEEPNSVILDEFYFNQYAGALEERSVALSDTGVVAFLGLIPDGDDEGSARDNAIIRAAIIVPPGDNYFWSGAAGTNLWHDKSGLATNWEDDQQMNWNEPPGTKGNEVVTINPESKTQVMLSNAPADIGALTAQGLLTVNQMLTVRIGAEIEDLILMSHLIADGTVGLSGSQSIWRSGEISGEAGVEIIQGGSLAIASSGPDALILNSDFAVFGQVTHENGNLDLAVGDSAKAGFIEIDPDGIYELQNGTVTDNGTGDGLISNGGIFRKTGSGTGTVGVRFNNQSGLFDVQGGTLQMSSNTRFLEGGNVAMVADNSVLEFGNADVTNETVTILKNASASGAGTLRLANGVVLDIANGSNMVAGLTGFGGEGLEIAKASISGTGSLTIANDQFLSGRATFLDATFESLEGGLTNNGVLDLGKEN